MVDTSLQSVAKHYGQMQVQTASHRKSVWMLHHRCVQFIESALDDPVERRANLDRAQNIIAQFQAVLNIDDRTSESLFLLYDYCYVLLERGAGEDCRNAGQIIKYLADTFQLLLRRQ